MRNPPPAPHQGEIWIAYLPGQPDDPHQPRPVLIVSDDARNRLTDDVMVVPIFSRGQLGPTHLPIQAGVGGLPRTSVLFCEELTTIDHDFLARGPLGHPVPTPLMEQVQRAVRRSLGEVVLEP